MYDMLSMTFLSEIFIIYYFCPDILLHVTFIHCNHF